MAYNDRFPTRTTCNGNSDSVFLHARTSGKGRSTTSEKNIRGKIGKREHLQVHGGSGGGQRGYAYVDKTYFV